MGFPERPEEDIDWAEGGGAQVEEPSVVRSTGFPFGFVLPAGVANWLQRATARWIRYLDAKWRFESMSQLVAALEPGDNAFVVTPDLEFRGTSFGRIDFPVNEVLRVATDGRRLFYLLQVGTNLQLYALDPTLDVGPTLLWSASDVDFGSPVFLEVNGALAAVAWTGSTDTFVAGITNFNEEALAAWVWDEAGREAQTLVVSHDAVFVSAAVSADEALSTMLRINAATGAVEETRTLVGCRIHATDGRRAAVVSLVAGGTLHLVNAEDLTDLWTTTITVSGSALTASATMTDRWVAVSHDEPDLEFFANSTEGPAAIGGISGFDHSILSVDVDDIFTRPVGATAPILNSFGHDLAGSSASFWHLELDGIDTAEPITDSCSDGLNVYVAGALSSGGSAIWQVSKGHRARLVQRTAPDDPTVWTRTLAVPVPM